MIVKHNSSQEVGVHQLEEFIREFRSRYSSHVSIPLQNLNG